HGHQHRPADDRGDPCSVAELSHVLSHDGSLRRPSDPCSAPHRTFTTSAASLQMPENPAAPTGMAIATADLPTPGRHRDELPGAGIYGPPTSNALRDSAAENTGPGIRATVTRRRRVPPI